MVVQQPGSAVDFQKINEVLQQRSSMDAKEISAYLRFVQMHGGGREGRFIDELMRFKKANVPTGRIISLGIDACLYHFKEYGL